MMTRVVIMMSRPWPQCYIIANIFHFSMARAGDGWPALLLCAIPSAAPGKNIWQKYRLRLRGAIIKSYR